MCIIYNIYNNKSHNILFFYLDFFIKKLYNIYIMIYIYNIKNKIAMTFNILTVYRLYLLFIYHKNIF